MNILELVVLLIIAAVAGVLGQMLGGYKRDGLLLAIVIGFVGALIGAGLARGLGLPILLSLDIGGVSFPFLWAIIGAALFVALISFMSGQRKTFKRLTPPTQAVFVIAVLLAVLALLVANGIVALPFSAFMLMTVAFVLLLLGNLLRGL